MSELEEIRRCISNLGPLDLSDLVQAGELIYINHSLADIIEKIINVYAVNRDVSSLMKSSFTSIMYQLKRHQNLDDFFARFHYEYQNIPPDSSVSFQLSLRMFIHLLLLKSDFSLSRKLITLLSKRNPVPFVHPPVSMSNIAREYEFVSEILHVWNYSSPTVLSFGIDRCQGKSNLLNKLFVTMFGLSVESIYFDSTIDIDFGYNFSTRRATNIADAHGPINRNLLMKIHSLFDGFLIHVEQKYLLKSVDKVKEMIQIVNHDGKYLLLIVRDVPLREVKQVDEFLAKELPQIRSFILPNVAATNLANDAKIIKLQQQIWEKEPMPTTARPNAEESIKTILRQIISPDYANRLQQIQDKIKQLEDQLLSIARNEHRSQTFLKQYLLFSQLCRLKTDLNNARFSHDGDDEKPYRLRQEIFTTRRELSESLNSKNDIFHLFVNILREEQRFTCLDLLSAHLQQDRSRNISAAQMAQQLPVHQSLSLEVLWRNAILCSQNSSIHEQKILQQDYYQYIRAGFPFEIVDGDNLNFQHDFLLNTFADLRNQHTLVISILGPQNSGKSTLLNYMFGTLFDVRNGRCTRGIYGSLIKSNDPKFKQILLLDTEGLFSVESRNEEYDRRIVLFCFAVSHIVLINVAKEFDKPVRDIILACLESLNKMGVTRIPRPIVHFVLNQQADPARCGDEAITLLQSLRRPNEDDNGDDLQNRVDLRLEYFHSLPAAFHNEGKTTTSSPGMSSSERTNSEFLDKTQQLCQKIFKSMDERQDGSIVAFADILQWLSSSRTIFDVSQEYPDLTQYNDIYERRIDRDAREYIRTYLMETFSPQYRKELIDDALEKAEDEINHSFAVTKENIETKAMEDLQNQLKSLKATKKIRQRSENFLLIQIHGMLAGLKNTATAMMERKKVQDKISKAQISMQRLLDDVINKKQVGSPESIVQTFHEECSREKQTIESYFVPTERLRQSIKHVYTYYTIYERDYFPEMQTITGHTSIIEEQIQTRIPKDVVDAEIYRNYFIKEMHETNSLIEFLPFDPKISIYTSNITQKLRYLNKTLLQDKLNDFMSPRNLNNRTDDSTDAFLKSVRDQLHKERQDNPKDIRKHYFPLISSFDELLRRTIEAMRVVNSNETRQIGPELIQHLVGLVNQLIEEIDQELGPFCVQMTRPLKTHCHLCVILLLSRYYFDEQRRYFDETLRQYEEHEKEMAELIHTVSNTHMSVTDNHAINFLKQWKDYSFNLAKDNCRKIIDRIVQENKQINRTYIQQLCDDSLLGDKTDEWIDSYLAEPMKIIGKCYQDHWKRIEDKINEEIITNKFEYLRDLNTFFDCFPNFWNILSKMGSLEQITKAMFETKGVDSNSQSALIDKQQCLFITFYRFATRKNIFEEIHIGRKRYSMKRDAVESFQAAAAAKQATTSANSLSHKVKEEQNRIRQDWNNLELTFEKLDNNDTFSKFRDRALGCSALCPCCRRPCDVDHTQFLSKPGSALNEHQCKSGHILRAMNGYKLETIDEPSLLTCEQIADDDVLVIDSSRHLWSKFKGEHKEWNFKSDLDNNELNALHGKFLALWKKIGPRICEKYQMKFVTFNSVIPQVHRALHYILLLDKSGSMSGHPWRTLLNGVKGFMEIRQKWRTEDLLTIIVFSDNAETIHFKKRFNEVNLDSLPIPSGMTAFIPAFQKVYECISETQSQYARDSIENQYSIIFMTDGESTDDPLKVLQTLKDKFGKNIRQFQTLALNTERDHWAKLEMINEIMNGTYYDIDKVENLPKRYAEVASKHVLLRSSRIGKVFRLPFS